MPAVAAAVVVAGAGPAVTGAEPAAAVVSGAGQAAAVVTGAGQAATVAGPGSGMGRDSQAAGVISTVAGGVGGPARGTRVALSNPCGLSFAARHVYVGDATTVRAMNPRTGRLTTVAGSGQFASRGDGGLATRASLDGACAMVRDQAGNVVIADTYNNRIRVVAASAGTFYGKPMKAGHIYAVAGNGLQGFRGDGGPATSASLDEPQGVAVDAAGNLVIADSSNDRVRVVAGSAGTFYGQAMKTGDIYTVAGGGTAGLGDGGPATSAELLPVGVTVDATGNLVIADPGNNRIRVVAKSTGTFYGQAMKAGDIYTVAGGGTAGLGDGGPATSAQLEDPNAVAVGTTGNLVISDYFDERVRVVAERTASFYGQAMTAGDIYTVAGDGADGFGGDGGPGTSAQLSGPMGVTVDAAGNVLIADTLNFRVRAVAAHSGTFYRTAMTAGDIYTVAGNGDQQYSGDGGPATSAQLDDPHGVAVDAAGDQLIADTNNNRVRMVPARSGTFYGKAMTAGHIYTVAGNGDQEFSGDGGPATSAGLSGPTGVAVDAAGNLLIADRGNSRIRVVAASTGTFYGQQMTAGDIYTVAGDNGSGYSGDGGPATSASLGEPQDVTVDAAGNLFIGDTADSRVRMVPASSGTFFGQAMTAGHIYTVAGNGDQGFSGDGGPATSAKLADPEGVAVDAAGNLVITDLGNNRVRVVAGNAGTFYGKPMTADHIYTVAGGGTAGLGDGGPATSAELATPEGATVDAAGNLVIADTNHNRIRVVAESTGTFYGKPMTADHIYTVAGNGISGFSGDGHPASKAEVYQPCGTTVDAAGNLLIADTGNGRVRQVTG